jgi:GLPGLI family protein
MRWTFKHSLLLLFFCFSLISGFAQIKSGKIVFERRTNLYKKFKDDNVRDWIREEDKNKIDIFELYFNDTISLFRPEDSELKETMSWATSKNVVYQNFSKNYRMTVKKIWGEELFLEDTLNVRQWKITDSRRSISGYNCRKAIWKANDSTIIYAWYCEELIPSVGPESFYGLPGAILGIATEDGGVVYFAKSVEIGKPDILSKVPKKGKNKIFTTDELRAKLIKDFGKNSWAKGMLKDVFGLWQ